MDNRKQAYENIHIMAAPILPIAIIFLILFGESFPLFLVPLIVFLCITIGLAKRLSRKDAIAYPFVQYPFLLLLLVLFFVVKPGLAFILIFPMVFIINMCIGCLYFRFFKTKTWYTNLLVFVLTLVVTVALYSDHNGKSLVSIIRDALFQ